MQAVPKSSGVLMMVDMVPQLYNAANQLIIATSDANDSLDFLRAVRLGTAMVKVAVNSETGQVVALMYPDAETLNNSTAIQIHCVLGRQGIMRRHERRKIFNEYLSILFNRFWYTKIVAQVPERARLIRVMLEQAGFVLEGTHRREYDGISNMYYYGLLKEEFHG